MLPRRGRELTMLESLARLMDHMAEKHRGAKHFGDTCSGTLDGEIVSQVCQLCGEELVAEDYEEGKSMDYLKAAREAHECAQEVQGSPLTEEYRREAETCAFIAIAEQLRKLNECLGNVGLVIDEKLVEMGYVPPV